MVTYKNKLLNSQVIIEITDYLTWLNSKTWFLVLSAFHYEFEIKNDKLVIGIAKNTRDS